MSNKWLFSFTFYVDVKGQEVWGQNHSARDTNMENV